MPSDLHTQTAVFSNRLNCLWPMSVCQRPAGMLNHSSGPVAAKHRYPKLL